MDLGRCFITAEDARPGNVVKKIFLMAAQRVCGVGLKSVAWRKDRK